MLSKYWACLLGMFFLLTAAAFPMKAAETVYPDSYYGVCAHIGFDDPLMPQKLAKMREGGIRWARADFHWSGVEPQQGEWHFDSLDTMLAEAEKNGICILPILDYSNSWATPAVDHLDEWCNYVRTTVTRYRNRIRYWEVWNEENLGFSSDTPNGTEYTKLLKRTYETIKAVDPELTVVYGGLAKVPLDYFEESLQAGAGDYFDVMNIHPYRSGFFSMSADEEFLADLSGMFQMLEKYHIPPKPLWITEMGWSTLPGVGEDYEIFLQSSLRLLGAENSDQTIAYIDDPNYPESQARDLISILLSLPESFKRVPIKINDLVSISSEQHQILILPPSEAFPSPYFDTLCRFVENGGTLILTGGTPLYYECKPDENGQWVRCDNAASEEFRQRLRIGWQAFWFDHSVPENGENTHSTDILRQASDNPEKVEQMAARLRVSRFLNNSRLTEGDEMIPLAFAVHEGKELPFMVLYRYHDWKGKILLSTSWQWADWNRSTVANQAVFLAQSMLLARCGGTAKYFWYEFQAPETNEKDAESFFGMTHADLSPKPGYIAYKTLTAAAPEGSSDFCRRTADSGIEIVSWQRPDGKKGWAVWAPGHYCDVPLNVDGTIEQAFDLLGNPADVSLENGVLSQTWKPAVQYFIGPDNMTPIP